MSQKKEIVLKSGESEWKESADTDTIKPSSNGSLACSKNAGISISDEELSALTSNAFELSLKTSSASESLQPSQNKPEDLVIIEESVCVLPSSIQSLLKTYPDQLCCGTSTLPTYKLNFKRVMGQFMTTVKALNDIKELNSSDVEVIPDSVSALLDYNLSTPAIISAIKTFFSSRKSSLDELLVEFRTLEEALDEIKNRLNDTGFLRVSTEQCLLCSRMWTFLVDTWNSACGGLKVSIFFAKVLIKHCEEKLPETMSEVEDITKTLDALYTDVLGINQFYFSGFCRDRVCVTQENLIFLRSVWTCFVENIPILRKFYLEYDAFDKFVKELKQNQSLANPEH